VVDVQGDRRVGAQVARDPTHRMQQNR
jgi:hypothetical protein